jgi:hypothetical protein
MTATIKTGYVAIVTVKSGDHAIPINCAEAAVGEKVGKSYWFTRKVDEDSITLQFSFRHRSHLVKWIELMIRKKLTIDLKLSPAEGV